MLKKKTFYDKIFKYKICIVLSDEESKLQKLTSGYFDSWDSSNACCIRGASNISRDGIGDRTIFMIFNPKVFNKNKILLGTIAHECVHACNFIFESRGVDLDLKNDETQAYYIDYLVRMCSATLKKFIDNE